MLTVKVPVAVAAPSEENAMSKTTFPRSAGVRSSAGSTVKEHPSPTMLRETANTAGSAPVASAQVTV